GAFLDAGNGSYEGMFTLSMSKLQLAALGAYENDHGKPSMFIYGVLDEPMGGPPFLFVMGVAAGFGFNRKMIAPPVTDIGTFPLVSVATGATPGASANTTDLSKMLDQLSTYIPPDPGQYFVAVGVKFTTYKVVSSFALLIVQFGKYLEFDLLGTSKYVAPNPNDPKPVAVVELELVGSYKPDSQYGSFLLQGQLTPNSFVLSQQCHLQGGFAIAFWTKGSREGDFVFTFGGYGPTASQQPDYYPQNVPQLQFLWQVDSEVSIKGGGFWALTPHMIAAGGYLKAAFNSSWVRASFDINAQFEIAWSPLHYMASFSVSFSLSIKLDFFGISKWIGFTIGEGLSIHGPEFGGTAHISLYVCTVNISFGAPPAPKPLLTGSAFSEHFLPAHSLDNPNGLLSITIEDGLVKKEKDIDGTEIYFINPKELKITTDCFVPATSINSTTPAGTSFEIPSMGVTFAGTDSAHTVTISSDEGEEPLLEINPLAKNAAMSIWKNPDAVADPTAVSDKLTTLQFGTEITPAAATVVPFVTPSIGVSNLDNDSFYVSGSKWDGSSYDSSGSTTDQWSSPKTVDLDETMFGTLTKM
ncbi:MAG: DUF6603 domain-containing protein, partial [Bacteroidota bacterium]